MNSSLQCLAHTFPFIRYYLSGRYKDEINRVNPLGFKGELAKAFADLMSDLWQVTCVCVSFYRQLRLAFPVLPVLHALPKELMHGNWGGVQGKQVVQPSQFKSVLSTFSKTFEGFQQHDSQELLAFLLDGLHEDQNRVIDKPFLPDVESGGRPDKELADEAWANHKLRNDSFVVDHCQVL